MSETISEARGGNVLQKALRNKRVLNVISIVLFLGIWDLIVVVGNATMMPRPWEVVTELIDMFQFGWLHTAHAHLDQFPPRYDRVSLGSCHRYSSWGADGLQQNR